MGYGQNLKEILDRKGMTVKELAKKAGIAPTTIYSIIQRDTAVRFDTALRISNILDIPINSICKDNPYDDIETLPPLPSDSEKHNIDRHKNAYISDRTARILKKFDYTELPMVDELLRIYMCWMIRQDVISLNIQRCLRKIILILKEKLILKILSKKKKNVAIL